MLVNLYGHSSVYERNYNKTGAATEIEEYDSLAAKR